MPHGRPALVLWTLGPDFDLSADIAAIERKVQLRG